MKTKVIQGVYYSSVEKTPRLFGWRKPGQKTFLIYKEAQTNKRDNYEGGRIKK